MLLFQVALLSDESELAISLSLRLTHSYSMATNWQEAHEILTSCPGVEVKIANIVFFHCIPTYLSILKAALPFRPPPLPFFGACHADYLT